MNVDPEKLAQHLNGILAPLYVVGGEEPLQIEESLDLIRAAARKQGFDERIVMHVDASFDWDTLQAGRDSMSLFSERRILDLRLPTGKPGADGAKALTKYAGEIGAYVRAIVAEREQARPAATLEQLRVECPGL